MNICFPFHKNHSFGRSKEAHYLHLSILFENSMPFCQREKVKVLIPNKNDNKYHLKRCKGTNEGSATEKKIKFPYEKKKKGDFKVGSKRKINV
jgi:hypothetical protein